MNKYEEPTCPCGHRNHIYVRNRNELVRHRLGQIVCQEEWENGECGCLCAYEVTIMHDSTWLHDINATIARWYEQSRARAQRYQARRFWNTFCYVGRLVRDHDGPRTIAGVPIAVSSVDAFLNELAEVDPGGVPAIAAARRSAIATRAPGEVALAEDVIDMALASAALPYDCEARKDARAWLQDGSRLYSARVCFEALGIDYDAAMEALAKKWAKEDASNG